MKFAANNLRILIAVITGLLLTAVSASLSPDQPAQVAVFLGILASIFSWIGLSLNATPADPFKELVYNALFPAQVAQIRELLADTQGVLPRPLADRLARALTQIETKRYLTSDYLGEDLREMACLFSVERIIRLLLPTSLMSVKLAAVPAQASLKLKALELVTAQVSALEELLRVLESLKPAPVVTEVA